MPDNGSVNQSFLVNSQLNLLTNIQRQCGTSNLAEKEDSAVALCDPAYNRNIMTNRRAKVPSLFQEIKFSTYNSCLNLLYTTACLQCEGILHSLDIICIAHVL